MDKTKKEGNMKKLKILAVVLALGALCMGVLSGCDNGKDGLETGEGTFYTLQKAYDEGYLTKEEIMSIAYYHNGSRVHNEEIMSEEYTPIPKTPQELSEETSKKSEARPRTGITNGFPTKTPPQTIFRSTNIAALTAIVWL